MANIIMCENRIASNPYMFLNTKVTVYSYEELCFYIYNNVVLVCDEDITTRLAGWLRMEIGMSDLADRVHDLIDKNAYVEDILVEILTAGKYYSTDEIRKFMTETARIRSLKSYEVDKLRADGYLKYKHYIKAGAIYDDIIAAKDKFPDNKNFLGTIYHNKAVALAGNLQIEEAKDCFIKAFTLTNDNESLIEYFYMLVVSVDSATLRKEIKHRGMPENFFDDLMMELADSKDDVHEMPIYNKVQRAIYNKLRGNLEDYDKRMDTILTELKDQFREQLV